MSDPKPRRVLVGASTLAMAVLFWLLLLVLSGCAGRTTWNATTTTKPDGTVIEEWGSHLGGDYGIIPVKISQGNDGDGGGGGILGAILPGFNYSDSHERTFVEARQDTYIHASKDGLIIKGPFGGSTSNAIQGDAINRGIRNVATLIGWWKTMGTLEAMHLAEETTKRVVNNNSTKVNLQELFTQEELAAIDADITKFQAGAESQQALKALENTAAQNAAAAELELLRGRS